MPAGWFRSLLFVLFIQTVCKDTWKNAIFHLIDYCCLDRQEDKEDMCNFLKKRKKKKNINHTYYTSDNCFLLLSIK